MAPSNINKENLEAMWQGAGGKAHDTYRSLPNIAFSGHQEPNWGVIVAFKVEYIKCFIFMVLTWFITFHWWYHVERPKFSRMVEWKEEKRKSFFFSVWTWPQSLIAPQQLSLNWLRNLCWKAVSEFRTVASMMRRVNYLDSAFFNGGEILAL